MYASKSRAPGPVSPYSATSEDGPLRDLTFYRPRSPVQSYETPQWDGVERRRLDDRRQQDDRRERSSGDVLFDTRSPHERRRHGRRVTDRAVALSLKV